MVKGYIVTNEIHVRDKYYFLSPGTVFIESRDLRFKPGRDGKPGTFHEYRGDILSDAQRWDPKAVIEVEYDPVEVERLVNLRAQKKRLEEDIAEEAIRLFSLVPV